MNAKQTIAILSLLAVIAAAFAAIPADAASGYEITAEYKETSTARIIVTLPDAVPADNFAKIYVTGDETDIEGDINFKVGQTKGRCTLESPLANGTYTVVVDTIFGVSSPATMTVGPVPVEHLISTEATPAEGGEVTTDKNAAYADDIVTITVTESKDYKLSMLKLNGQPLDKGTTTFVMPDANVLITAVFEPAVTYCDVTFVVSSDIEPVTVKAVSEEIFKDVPAAPGIIGVQFDGWFTEDGVEFDFEKTPVTKSMTVYAHYGPEAPSTEQTTKFVAAMSDECDLVLTAYDGNIIGKGTAKVTVYKMETIRGMNMYVAVGTFDADFESDGVYLVKDVSEDVGKIATAAGSYAVAAFVTLDNTTEQQTDYATFEIDGQA